jgi:O-antigen ligase
MVFDKFKPSDVIRVKVWQHAIKCVINGKILLNDRVTVKAIPMSGFGFGSFLQYFPRVAKNSAGGYFNFDNEKFSHAHNDYVELFFEIGIGVIFMFMFIFDLYRRALRALRKKNKIIIILLGCITAYLIDASGNFISHLAVSGMIITILYGLLEGEIRDGRFTGVC